MSMAMTMTTVVAEKAELNKEEQVLSQVAVKPQSAKALMPRFIICCVTGMMYGSLGYSLISTFIH